MSLSGVLPAEWPLVVLRQISEYYYDHGDGAGGSACLLLGGKRGGGGIGVGSAGSRLHQRKNSHRYQRRYESHVGEMVRINLSGIIHDTFIIEETTNDDEEEEDDTVKKNPRIEGTSVLLFSCGAALRVPRTSLVSNKFSRNSSSSSSSSSTTSFSYGLTWAVPPDTNPHSLRQLNREWISKHISVPLGQGGIKKIDLMTIGPGELDSRNDNVHGLRGAVSHHRRIRLFHEGETRRHPTRKPHILYCKLSTPYLALFSSSSSSSSPYPSSGIGSSGAGGDGYGRGRPTDGYMRESAAYQLLHHCRPPWCPQVSPVCHYSHFHPVTGSYAILLESLDVHVQYRGTVVETFPDHETGRLTNSLRDTMADAVRVVHALAALHGRFLTPPPSPQTSTSISRSNQQCEYDKGDMVMGLHQQKKKDETENNKEVDQQQEQEMVAALDISVDDVNDTPPGNGGGATTTDSKKSISSNKKSSSSSSRKLHPNRRLLREHMLHERVFCERWRSKLHHDVDLQQAVTALYSLSASGTGPGPETMQTETKTINQSSPALDRITLIHGRLSSQHILIHPDPRHGSHPGGALLVDWKYCGLGPLEVDLIHLYLSLPVRKYRMAWLPTLLREYCEQMEIWRECGGGGDEGNGLNDAVGVGVNGGSGRGSGRGEGGGAPKGPSGGEGEESESEAAATNNKKPHVNANETATTPTNQKAKANTVPAAAVKSKSSPRPPLLTPLQLLCHMRDTCLLLCAGDGFEWNGDGKWCEYMIAAHEELLYMTSDRRYLAENRFL